MNFPQKIQGREISLLEVAEIKEMLSKNPTWTRTKLSREICKHWNWIRLDGQIKDIACRELLRKLEKRSLIELPPSKQKTRSSKKVIEFVEVEMDSICDKLSNIQPIRIEDARSDRKHEKTFNYLLSKYHYLSYNRTVGQNMKYVVLDKKDRYLGCVLFGAPAWQCEDRDKWIGWSAAIRERNLNLTCNNTRFLILPSVRVPHLASCILGKCLRRLLNDWKKRYGRGVVLVETFVDTTLYLGTCYKAANWKKVGKTKGRSRQDRYTKLKVPIKDIWVIPLRSDYKEVLTKS